MGARAEPASASRLSAMTSGKAVLDREPVLPLEPARPRRAADRLDDPAAVERLQEDLGHGEASPRPAAGRSPPATPCGTPAPACPGAGPRDCPARRPAPSRNSSSSRGLGRVGTGEDLLDLVQEDDQRFAEPRLLGTPVLVQGGRLVRQSFRASRSDPEQALLLIPAAISDRVAAGLQPRHQPGVQERRLAHPRGPVQEQDRRPGRVGDLLVQLADLVAATEEDLGVLGGEPGSGAGTGSRAGRARGRRGKAELGVASGVGEAPRARRAQSPGGTPRGSRGRRSDPGLADVDGAARSRGGRSMPRERRPGRPVRVLAPPRRPRASGLAGGQLGVEGDGEFARHARRRWPVPW